MKKFLLIFNIALLVAVGILYYLYFRYVREDLHERKAAQAQVANTFKVAYFDFDTLETYYEYSKEVRSYLMKKDSVNEKTLQGLQKQYSDSIKEFNRIGRSLSQTQQSSFQQTLTEMQENYQQQQQALGQQIQAEYIQKQQGVKSEIQKFLKTYCRDKGYAYVFATKEYDDFMYYKDTIRNITVDIIKGLNDQYRIDKKK